MNAGTAVRVAHFSDLHFGPRNLHEADRCFGAAIDDAIACGAELAVISGDSTDHALDLHAPASAKLVAHVRRLLDHCPVLMLQGTWSHEPPGTLTVFRQLGGRHAIHVADRIGQVGLRADGGWVESADWRFDELPDGLVALFSCLPSVNKAALAAAVGGADAAGAIGDHVAALLRGFTRSNVAARACGVPTLLVSHGTVYGCVTEHGVPMAGFDGAWVRVRWCVGEEDRHAADRDAVQALLAGAAGVQIEQRVVPVVRSRASGIAQATALEDKVRTWATVVEARAEPLLACLRALQSNSPDEIVSGVLAPSAGAERGDPRQVDEQGVARIEFDARVLDAGAVA
jgi:exonuclease SbcD